MSTATRSASAQRFAARSRRRRLRLIMRVLLLVVLAVAVGGVGWLVGWSSVLSVQNVRVAGVEGELADDVAEVAEVPIGEPLIRVDGGAVAQRVRELPDVRDVDVLRSWPRTLTIDVKPRTAQAAVRDGGTWWQVDESGILFGRSDTAPDGIPALEAPTEEPAVNTRAAGVAVLTSLPSSLDDMVESVHAESAADVRLELEDGVTVLWGTAERSEDKARVLLALMEQQEEPPSSYNVSAPDTPAVIP